MTASGGVAPGSRPWRVAIHGRCRDPNPLLAAVGDRVRRPVALLGVFDDRPWPPEGEPEDRPDGNAEDLLDLGRRAGLDELILVGPQDAGRFRSELWGLAVDISVVDGASEAPDGCPDGYKEPVLRRLMGAPPRPALEPLRRRLEQAVAAFAVLATLPLLAAIACLVKLESDGPVLFRQKRYGHQGRIFELYKFRTMHHAACDPAGSRQSFEGDSRVTRLGAFLRRTSLDELPQLFNVLKGEMSLIGPRPHPIGMRVAGRSCREVLERYFARYRVVPGITGWAQVNALRGPADSVEKLRQRLEHDLDYIEHRSLLLDLKILFPTFMQVSGLRPGLRPVRGGVRPADAPGRFAGAAQEPTTVERRGRTANASEGSDLGRDPDNRRRRADRNGALPGLAWPALERAGHGHPGARDDEPRASVEPRAPLW